MQYTFLVYCISKGVYMCTFRQAVHQHFWYWAFLSAAETDCPLSLSNNKEWVYIRWRSVDPANWSKRRTHTATCCPAQSQKSGWCTSNKVEDSDYWMGHLWHEHYCSKRKAAFLVTDHILAVIFILMSIMYLVQMGVNFVVNGLSKEPIGFVLQDLE